MYLGYITFIGHDWPGQTVLELVCQKLQHDFAKKTSTRHLTFLLTQKQIDRKKTDFFSLSIWLTKVVEELGTF